MARDSRGRFLPRGRRGGKRRRSTALVRRSRSTPTRRRGGGGFRRRGRRRRGGDGGGLKLWQMLAAGGVVGYASKNMPDNVSTMLSKVPGTATWGKAGTIGLLALGLNRFVWRNRWLKLIGIGGVIAAAYEWGQKGFKLEWVGDVGDGFVSD